MQPKLYLQIDKRWKHIPYAVKGESATIGGSGCGPTCMAMVISTLTGKEVTPVDACKWALDHGYKAKGQGTYYSYFAPQGKVYGIGVRQLNGANLYHHLNSPHHQTVLNHLKSGGMVIACMGKGNWTRSGHFVLLWGVNPDGTININDPASTRPNRVRGNWTTLRNEVKYYFLVESKKTTPPRPKSKKEKLMEKFSLSPGTVDYIAKYKYGDDLINKLLGDTANLSLHKGTINYILAYEYGADLLKKICK